MRSNMFYGSHWYIPFLSGLFETGASTCAGLWEIGNAQRADHGSRFA
jgi:hypothetical protein